MNICGMTNSSIPQILGEEDELPSVLDTVNSLARDVLAKVARQRLSSRTAERKMRFYMAVPVQSPVHIYPHDEKLELPCFHEIYKFQIIGQKSHKHTHLFPNTNRGARL